MESEDRKTQGEGWDDDVTFKPASTDELYEPITWSVLSNGPRLVKISEDINEVNAELRLVQKGRYDTRRATKIAALALSVQLELAEILPALESSAKGYKVDAEVVEGDLYEDLKGSFTGKPTDAALSRLASKDTKTVAAKRQTIKAEKEAKTCANIILTMKEAHIFFRNLGKE